MKKTLSKIINKIYDGDNNIDISEMRYLPRWGVLFIDVCILLFSLLIIEQIGVYFTGTMDFYKKCSLIVGVNVFFMIIFRTYSGIVRHSTFIDLSKIFLSIVYTIFVLVILNVVVYWRMDYKLFKTSLLLVYAGVSFVLLFIYRLFVKEFFNFIREYRKNFQKKRILVLGIDEVSVSLAKIIADNSSVPYHLVGFITERTDSKQASLLNRKIYTKNDIDEADVILFDCVTNFVSNYMIMDREIDWDNVDLSLVHEIEDKIEEETINFLEFVKSKKCDCVFVTNEIGSGLVPDYPLGRYFRDICGRINQLIAKNSDEAYLAVSGIKVKIK